MLPTRRAFLRTSTLLALAPAVPAFLARTARAAAPDRDGRVFVVVQLDGGNDGLNTVVPFGDDAYGRLRRVLRVPANELIKLDGHAGLHPALKPAAGLLEAGQLAVVQGVGYPNPNRSHFRSMAVWHTARFDPEEHTGLGWVGRALDGGPAVQSGHPGSVFVGPEAPPVALRGRRAPSSALARLDDLALPETAGAGEAAVGPGDGDDLSGFVRRVTLDAYAAAARVKEAARAEAGAGYPGSDLAGRLRLIARLLKSGFGARVFYTLQAGYDTHAQQAIPHAALLGELASALAAFFADLGAARLGDRVAVLAFSEFGRTVKENASGGTDHGTAAPVFLAGPAVRGGAAGTPPSLTDLEAGEPRMTVDFRQVYATVLEDWLGLPAKAALAGEFERLPLFHP
jgi:uncharacterized protein (DUF1501 family)